MQFVVSVIQTVAKGKASSMNTRLVFCGATCLSLSALLISGVNCVTSSSSPGLGSGGTPGSDGGIGNSGSGGSNNSTGGTNGNPTSDAGSNGTDGGAMGGAGGVGAIDYSGPSVLTRNKHISRDGYFTDKALTKAAVKMMAGDTAFNTNATLAGTVWASPLYLEQGPGGKGIFIMVTQDKSIVAFDETDGHAVWMKSYGPAPSAGGGGHGSPIKIAGFNGTPVIDPTPNPADGSATIYVAGGIGNGGTTMGSELHALSAKDGSERAGWPVSITKIQTPIAQAAGFTAFNPSEQAQRGALQLVNGIVYVPFGGYFDPPGYRGWVVAIDIADPTKSGAWVTRGNGGGIWAAGGTASDGNGVIAVTGNHTPMGGSPAMNLDGESVVRITGHGTLTRDDTSSFYPTGPDPANPFWKQMDIADTDFGSNSPVVLKVGDKNYVGAVSKDGHLFLLDAANFGGTDVMGIPKGGAYLKVSGGGMNSRTAVAAYNSTTGAHLVFSTGAETGCPNGGGGGVTIMSVAVSAGPPPSLKVAWCAAGGETSPISTTSDGNGADSIVWFVAAGKLMGVDGDTGAPLASPAELCAGTNTKAYTSPIAVKGRIIASANGHLCSWSVH